VTCPLIELGELMARRSGSVDPTRFPDEEFELHSIPAFDAGRPEFLFGSQIGSSKQIVQPNDVMISKIVPHIRRASVVGSSPGRRQIASGEWIVFRSVRVFSRYLRHVLISDEFNRKFMATVSGVGGSLLRARPAEVAKIKIPLPALDEQRRIAGILDKADALRAKRREAIAKLDQLLQSVFLDMFGDPITNPMSWPMGKLAELGELDRGVSRHRPRGAPELLDGKHPLIQTGDVARSAGYIRDFTATYSDAGLAQSKKWPSGTLCITIAANIAETGILTFDACFPDSVVGFTANRTSNAEFVQALMGFLRGILEEKAPQVAQKNINLAILRELPVPIPPIERQKNWALFAARVEQMRQRFRAADVSNSKLFVSLQRDVFTGPL
jgi:type I restriction enzyme S subunit